MELDLEKLNRELAKLNRESNGRLFEALRRMGSCAKCGKPLTDDDFEQWNRNVSAD